MAKNNVINNMSDQFTVNNTSSNTDLRFAGGAWTMGIEGGASTFNIDDSVTLTSSSSYIITSNGEITAPETPAALGNNTNTSYFNITGAGAVATLTFNQEVYDQNFDLTTTTFTAPISGKFLITANFALTPLATYSADQGYLQIDTSNRDYRSAFINYGAVRKGTGTSAASQCSLSVICDMDSSDIAQIKIMADGGGSDGLDIYQFSSYFHTFWSVGLIC